MGFDFQEQGVMGGAVDTSDDTPTRLFEVDMADFDGLGSSLMGVLAARMMVIGGRTTGHFHARISQVTVKIVAGTASLLTAEAVESESSEEAWTVATSIDGTKLAVDVTGEAEAAISWRAYVQFTYGGFGAS